MPFKKIISIHGVPRSGTSWLGQIFDSSPNIKFKFQPLFSYRFKDSINFNSTKNNLMKFFTEIYNTNDFFLDRIAEKESGIYPKDFNKNVIPEILATKMVRYHYYLPLFFSQLDIFNAVFIIRNPCAVLASWKKARKEYNKEWDFEKEWFFANKKNLFRTEEYNGFFKWIEATNLFQELTKKYPKRTKIIRYKDLVTSTEKEITNVFDFFEIELTDQTLDFIEKSTTIKQTDSYSVFKGKKNPDEWKILLDSNIIKKIEYYLKDSVYEQYLY